MKILHVETGCHFLGGPQQVVYLVGALRERGIDNVLVCPPGSGIDGAARRAGIRVVNLSCAGDLDLPFAYRLARLLRRDRPDVVHCHGRRGADVLGGIAARLAGVPAVVSRRVDNPEPRIVARLRYRPFRKVIAISEAIAAVLRARGIDEPALEVIRSAVDAGAFGARPGRAALRDELGVPDDAFGIAAAGQLIPRKGHRYLLQAVAQLHRGRLPLRLVIFGAGRLQDRLCAQAAALGLGDVVHFAGYRDDLDDLLGCFDLFVHPSLAEGLGVAALKARAAGVPVVACDAGGLREAVEHGVTGLLVPPGDAEALREAIATLMADDGRRERMAAAGRERMQKAFSIDTMADRHASVYASLFSD